MKILLIGQGIAGTLLAWTLRKMGNEVHIADGDLAGSSSRAAAGIINPVTGKRFVKSWRFDEFYPVARETYLQLEQELNIPIWEDRPILRLLGTAEEANDWAVRCAQADYADLLGETTHAGDWAPYLKPGFGFGIIRKAARVNFPLLIAAYREKVISDGFFHHKSIDYPETDSLLQEYDQLVFCEGYRAALNPYFPEASFRVSKGEALIIRFVSDSKDQGNSTSDQSRPVEMVKKTVLLTPLGNGTFWAGSNYRWQFEDGLPEAASRAYILEYLQEMLAAPFEVVDHVAGIRPTMLDRRPFVGQSSLNPKVFIFNGLGTKGALLAPYFAEQLAEQMHSV